MYIYIYILHSIINFKMFYPFIRPSWDRQSSSTEVLRWVTSRLEQQKTCVLIGLGLPMIYGGRPSFLGL